LPSVESPNQAISVSAVAQRKPPYCPKIHRL
jgi:hypothetical protein